MDKDFNSKFSKVLNDALKNGKVKFPDEIFIEYQDKKVYRMITRKKNGLELSKNDFLSQVELKQCNPKIKNIDENNIENYSCSVFSDEKMLETVLHLPRKNKLIIKGYMKYFNGICDKEKNTTHINWWLYDKSSPESDFELLIPEVSVNE